MEWLFGQKPSAVSRGRSLKELAKLAIKKFYMTLGVFMRHQTSNNMEVQNKTISETNAQSTLLLRPQGDGEWLGLMLLWTSNLIRREGEMRDGKSRRSWRRSKDQIGQESRAAGKAGDRGYEVLPVTATRTEQTNRVAANPYWPLRFWGPKHSTNPWARLHIAAGCQHEHFWQRRGRTLCTSSGAVLPQQPLCFQERSGRVWRKWCAFSWTGSKLTHITPTISPHTPGCWSLSSELRTHHVPVLCAPDHAAVAGLSGFPGVSQSVWMTQEVLSHGWTIRAKAYPGAIALTRCLGHLLVSLHTLIPTCAE